MIIINFEAKLLELGIWISWHENGKKKKKHRRLHVLQVLIHQMSLRLQTLDRN